MNMRSQSATTTALILIGLTIIGLTTTVIVQATSTAYAFGQLANKVANNHSEIILLERQDKSLQSLNSKVAVLQQKLLDDERILHSIANAVGAKGER